MIHLRIVKPVEQMDCPRPRGRQTHPDIAGKFRVGGSHERGHFLVPRLDKFEPVAGASQCADQPVDAVSGISEYSLDTPSRKAFPEEVANGFSHILPRAVLVSRAATVAFHLGASIGAFARVEARLQRQVSKLNAVR
jgi:hypothetical protein